MKLYETPVCRITVIDKTDVVCTSNENETPKIDLND